MPDQFNILDQPHLHTGVYATAAHLHTGIYVGTGRVVKRRQSTDLTLNNAAWTAVSASDFDITLNAVVGDELRATVNALQGNVATFVQYDVATIVSAAPVNYFSSGTATPNGTGVGSWRYNNTGVNHAISGAVFYTVKSGDLSAGTVKLQWQFKQNTGTNFTLFASASISAAVFSVENLGPAGA